MVSEPISEAILEVRHLSVDYASDSGTVQAVDDVSFSVKRGEIFGLAGESGSGKSTLAFALARLLKFPAKITNGQIQFNLQPESPAANTLGESVDILELPPEDLRQFRWILLSIVFQSAMNALNPVLDIETQIVDVMKAHDSSMSSRQRHERCRELMRLVGISPDRLRSYPHQLSGGMRQRAIIAMALALSPELIIMDEPTTALDVVVQREILNEIKQLQAQLGFSVIFITHDLSLLLEISNHIAIMYAGRLVELADQEQLITHPYHPYSYGLIHSFPDLHGEKKKMLGIPGHPPDLRSLPEGCPFAPRCAFAFDACVKVTPVLCSPDPAAGRQVSCHLYDPAQNPSGPPLSMDPTQPTQPAQAPQVGETLRSKPISPVGGTR